MHIRNASFLGNKRIILPPPIHIYVVNTNECLHAAELAIKIETWCPHLCHVLGQIGEADVVDDVSRSDDESVAILPQEFEVVLVGLVSQKTPHRFCGEREKNMKRMTEKYL